MNACAQARMHTQLLRQALVSVSVSAAVLVAAVVLDLLDGEVVEFKRADFQWLRGLDLHLCATAREVTHLAEGPVSAARDTSARHRRCAAMLSQARMNRLSREGVRREHGTA